jgi:hypothetical protein
MSLLRLILAPANVPGTVLLIGILHSPFQTMMLILLKESHLSNLFLDDVELRFTVY